MTESMPEILGAVISITKGKKHEITDSLSGNAKRLIGIDDLRNDDLIRYTDDANGTEAIPDDVLIAWDGANAGTIGYGKNGYIGSTIARLRIRAGIHLFTPFLGLYLKSKFGYLRQTATGATIPHINRNALENIPLPDIEYDDQIRIAHLLGKVEELIAQRKQHLQQLDDLLKSVFLEMFGDPVRNEKGWNVVYWDDLFVTRTGKLNANAMSESGAYPFFTCAKEIFQIDSFAFDCEALILAGNNATGDFDVKYYKGKFNAYQRTYILELKTDTDEYPFFKLHLEMKLRQLKDGSKGANTRYLTKQFLDTIAFIQPGEAFQKKFSIIAKKVEALKSRYQQSLADLETLYGALSQRAFKGELDLLRVPMPAIQAEEEKTVAAEPVHTRTEESLAIHLPDTANLLDALENAEARAALIAQWLEAYRVQLGSTPFSVQQFMAAAQIRLAELHPDNDFELGAKDYEHIKTWVFEALAAGTLTQTLDEKHNRVTLKSRPAEWGSW